MPNGFLYGVARRIADGLSVAKGFGGVTWDGSAGWNSFGGSGVTHYPGSDMDWATEAGEPRLWLNSVASICAGYVFDKVVEPRIHVVYEDGEGMLQPVAKHPATDLLFYPNSEYLGNALLQGLALSYKFDGNAYALKVRGNRGNGAPVEIYYIPHWLMWPIVPEDGGPTEFYAYRRPRINGGFTTERIPRGDVIHIRNGMDPENPRKGLSRFKSQYRPFVSDNEIDSTVAVVLRNRGNMGAIITPESSDDEIEDDQFQELKRRITNQSTGDARGGVVGFTIPLKIDRTAISPVDLMLDKIGERPVARICQSFGIRPGTVGLSNTGQGKGGEYGAKQKSDDDASYRTAILPMLASFAEALTYQLLVDFPAQSARSFSLPRHIAGQKRWVVKASASVTRDYRFNFDYSEVSELGEDADAVSERAVDEFKGGIATLDEARELTGKKPCDDPEIGSKFGWQLLGPPAGDVGIIDPNNPETKPGSAPDADPDDEDLPEEDDEDFYDNGKSKSVRKRIAARWRSLHGR